MNRRRYVVQKIRTISIVVFTAGLIYVLANSLKCSEKSDPKAIDVVYTWVNGTDREFFTNSIKYNAFLQSNFKQRYEDNGELKYSLRSLEKHAPWVNHVYIVTNGQIPHWLDLNYDKVTVVTHEEIYLDKSHLPTFSSKSIETHLHRIKGLSRKFLYFNDDFFLSGPVFADDFYTETAGFAIYLSYLVPPCAPNCPWMFVADGQCDGFCYVADCQFDGGDCKNVEVFPKNDTKSSNKTSRFVPKLTGNETIDLLVRKHNANIINRNKMTTRKRKKHYINSGEDAYGDSLQHTNRLLNKHFGYNLRKAPCHAPILIDVEIMRELQETFSKEFESTSSHRCRQSDDLQFSMMYYHYLIESKLTRNFEEVLRTFDTDSSNTLNLNELRTLSTKLYDLPLTEEAIQHFQNLLSNCTGRSLYNSQYSALHLGELLECSHLKMQLSDMFEISKFKYHRIRDADKKYVHFKMLTTNITAILEQLDEVRKNPKKFVCFNNNLRSFPNEQSVKMILKDFYETLFPFRSRFELPEHQRNARLHIRHRSVDDSTLFIIFLVSFCAIFIILVKKCRRRLYHFVNMFIYRFMVT